MAKHRQGTLPGLEEYVHSGSDGYVNPCSMFSKTNPWFGVLVQKFKECLRCCSK